MSIDKSAASVLNLCKIKDSCKKCRKKAAPAGRGGRRMVRRPTNFPFPVDKIAGIVYNS